MEPRPDEIRWLTPEDLIYINWRVVGDITPEEPIGVRDPGLLESAQQAPCQKRYYEQTEDMFLLSAVLMSRVIRNHPFCSGNKRTGYASAYLLLWCNGYRMSAPTEEATDLCREIAIDPPHEEQVASWISDNTEPFDQVEALTRHPGDELDSLAGRMSPSSS